MNKRILVGGLFHESHTFARRHTSLRDFQENAVRHGQELIDQNKGTGSPMDGFLKYAAAQKWTVIPSVQMSARPSGG